MSEEQSPTEATKQTESDQKAKESQEAKDKCKQEEKTKAAKEKANKAQKHIERLIKVARVMRGLGGGDFPPYEEKTFDVLDENFEGAGSGGYFFVEHMPDRTIRKVSEEHVTLHVIKYLQNYIGDTHPQFRFFNNTDPVKIIDYFKNAADPIQSRDCKQIATIEDDALAFSRLPWGFNSCDSLDYTPTFKYVLSSVEYGTESLLAFIGSIFDESSDKSQYLYLFGEGGSGKSSITAFLRRILRRAAVVTEPPKFGDRFFMSTILNKRLVIFNDVEDYKVVTSPEVKTLTGDSTVFVDVKGKTGFNAEVNAKLMLCSNHEPGISSKTADTRRIIPVKMAAPSSGPKFSTYDMGENMYAEAQNFLSLCWNTYKKLREGATIPVVKEEIDNIAASNESQFHEVFDKFLFLDGDIGLSGSEIRLLAERLKWNGATRLAFQNWLKGMKGIKYCKTWVKKGGRKEIPKAFYGVGVVARYRKEFESPAPMCPSWSGRSGQSWREFVEGLGHKISAKEVGAIDGVAQVPDLEESGHKIGHHNGAF